MFPPDEPEPFTTPRQLLGILESLGTDVPGFGAALDDARNALAKWEAADPVGAVSEWQDDPIGPPDGRCLTRWPHDFKEAFIRAANMVDRQ